MNHSATTSGTRAIRKDKLKGSLHLLYSLIICVLAHGSLATDNNTYPDLQNIVAPNPQPTLPGGCDVFLPPVDAQTPAANAPTIAEWTRSAAPDDSLVITGSQFTTYTGADAGKDTEFLTYGQVIGTEGIEADAAVQRLDGLKCAVALDSALPAWSMYLMWPKNSNGYGYPVAVNRTDAWWLGPTKAVAGSTISVFGRNLAYQNGTTTSYVYVKPTGGEGQWATVTAVNPYKVDFTVPSLTNGTYEVWVHNGHGASYGWSGPLTLTVYSGPGWTSTDFNVRSYGAMGDGVTDDTAAIKAAIAASGSAPLSSVYFPSGIYMISNNLTPKSNSRWRGDGKTSTVIKCLPSFDGSHGVIFSFYANNNIELRDLTIDNNGVSISASYGTVFLRFISDLSLTNVDVKGKGSAQDFHADNNLKLTNCNFTGKGIFLGSGTQAFISGCNFYETNDATISMLEYGRCELAVTNCTGQNENVNLVDGWGQGRFFQGGAYWGVSRNVYIGDNTTYDLAVRPGYSNQNTGEQLMWEGNLTFYRGIPTSTTGTTVTFSDLATDYTGREVVVISGNGLGQHRPITAWNSSTKTITVSPAWNQAPDTTSTLIIAYSACRYAIYHNTFDAPDYAATNTAENASCGIEPFGGCLEFIADNNTFHQVRKGIALCGVGQASPMTDIQPNYFHLYTNNQFQNNRLGIYFFLAYYTNPGVDPGSVMLGNVIRRNTISSPILNEISALAKSWSSGGTPIDMNICEHNNGSNMPVSVDLSAIPGSGNHLFYKNSAALETGTYAGSLGIKLASGQKPALIGNTWNGFALTYAGTPPGAVLEIPYQYLTVTGSAYGIPVNDSLALWNAGSSSLTWNASADASWLVLSATTGTLANESGAGIAFTCNSASLNVGTYTSTITVTCTGQTKKITVVFTVVNPSPSPVGLQLWVKGDTGVTVDGSNNVTQWSDQSGSGNHLTPYNTSCYPQYVSSGINGLPTIRFNGIKSNLRKILGTPLPGSYTIYLVCSSPTAQVDQTMGGIYNRPFSCPTTDSEDYQKGMVIYTGTGGTFSPTLKQYTKTLDSGESIKTFGLGAMATSNNCIGTNFHYTGDISEVLIYNRSLTTQESQDVTTYLRNKYNLP